VGAKTPAADYVPQGRLIPEEDKKWRESNSRYVLGLREEAGEIGNVCTM
jgi:hypothetical protein